MEDDHAVGRNGDWGGPAVVIILAEADGRPIEAPPSRIDFPRHGAREPAGNPPAVGLQVRPGRKIVVEPSPRIDVGVIAIRAHEVPGVGIDARIGVGRPLEIQSGRQILTVDTRGDPDRRVQLAVVGHVVGRNGNRRACLEDRVGDRSRRAAVIWTRTDERPRIVVNPGVDVRGRESQVQTGRQILTKDSRHGPGGKVGLARVGRGER